MFAEHVSDQQFAYEFAVQLRIEPFVPGVKYRLKHVLKSHDSVMKEAVKEAEGEFRRNDEQLSRLRMFQIVLEMFDESVEPIVGVGKCHRRLDQAAMKALTLVPHERIEQLILRGEVTIKRAPRYACGLANGQDRHTMHARSQDYILCSRENRSYGGFRATASPASARRTCRRRRRGCGSPLPRLPGDRRRLCRLYRGLGSDALLG